MSCKVRQIFFAFSTVLAKRVLCLPYFSLLEEDTFVTKWFIRR